MLRFVTIAGLAVTTAGGCFTPAHDRCAVTCAADNGCPPSFSCLADGFCHAAATESLCSFAVDGGIDAPDDLDAGPGCGDGVRDTSMNEECDDDNGDDGDGCSAICREESGFVCIGDNGELSVCRPNPSVAGQLVITEILINSQEVGDEFGEWFEIHNPTGTDFDLRGMRIDSAPNESFTVQSSLPLAAGGHIVLGRDDDMNTNGGAPVALAYGVAIQFSNQNSDDIELSFSGVLIDRVEFFEAGETGGETDSLNPDTYDAVSNDMSQNFCRGNVAFGDGDLGTPGMLNPDC